MTNDPPPVDWDRLNEEFYSGDPAGYFRIRLNLLLLAAGAPDEVARLLEAGVHYDGMVTMELGRSSQERDDLLVAYLVTESQALLHHVSEALLRLFLAHARPRPNPWLSVSSMRDFAKFKEKVASVAAYTWPEDLTAALPRVFMGDMPSDSTESREEGVAAITRLIRHLAGGLLQDSNLYNSVKHGMAVIASEDVYVTLATGAGEPIIGSHGPSVGFLESEVTGDERTWKITRRWVSIRRALWVSQLALMEIDALWAIARVRYLGAELTGVHVVTAEAVEDGITGAFADLVGIHTSSRTVAVEHLPAGREARTRLSG